MKTQTQGIERGYRALKVKPNSLNDEKRTVEVILSTGSRGKRRSYWDDDWYEELAIEPGAVRLERLKNGAPFLDAHNSYSNDSVLGVFEDAWIEGNTLAGRVRFDTTEKAETRFQSVKNGILRNVSVGYDVHKFQELEERAEDGLKIYRAVDWEPAECSIVPIGFDNAAKIRNAESLPFNGCEVIARQTVNNIKGEVMEKDKPVVEPVIDFKAVAEKAVVAERERGMKITQACEKMGCKERALELIASGESYDAVAKRLIEEKKVSEPIIETRAASVSVGEGDKEKRMEGITNSVLFKIDRRRYAAEGKNNPYVGASMVDIARLMLGKDGEFGGRAATIKRAYNGTSDFPILLSNLAGKTLRDEYSYQTATFEPFVKRTTVPDFKLIERDRIGDAPTLLPVQEQGEYKFSTVAESREQYRVQKFGRLFGISWEALVNDDMSSFQRMPQKIAQAASRTESDLVWNIILNNAAMGDGVALFNALHFNMPAGATALTEPNLDIGYQTFMAQTGETGDFLNIPPAFLVVSPRNKAVAQRLMAQITPVTSGTVNPFAGEFQVIVESRLLNANAGLSWFLMAAPSTIDTIELAYLEEEGGLVLEEYEDPKTDGVYWKARLVAGAKAIDWRGMFMNTGA